MRTKNKIEIVGWSPPNYPRDPQVKYVGNFYFYFGLMGRFQ